MKTKENIKLITVGRLVKELSKFEKKCADYDVACWAPDYLTCCVTGHRRDDDGDVCIHLEMQEDDGGYCTVEMLLADLSSYDRNARVYMESCGYYLNFEVDGGIFTENDDDEIVGCYAIAFGEYEEEEYYGEDDGVVEGSWDHKTEWEKRYIAEEERKRKREERRSGVALVILDVLVACWLAYNVYALISHTGEHVAGNIMWIVVCAVLLVIGVLTLHFDKYKKS